MNKTIKKILIVGAGVAGGELAQELKKISGGYKLVGFVDDNILKGTKKFKGFGILGKIDEIGRLIKRNDIDELLIAIPSADGQTIRRILESARELRVKFKILPRTLELVRGKVQLHQLREVRVTDLFGKAIIKSRQPIFQKEFKSKSILVTGAAGSIGSELCRQIIQFSPKKLTAVDWSENGLFELLNELGNLSKASNFECVVGNIQDKDKVREVVRRTRPDIIFHAAAFKHVPLMQSNPIAAISNNVYGTENIAKVAYEEGVEKVILISTDKAVDPHNVMGASKLLAEHVVTAINRLGGTKYSVVRFGNVLESNGSVVPIFSKQIAGGGPVTVTDLRMTRFMMTIPEAVQLVLSASIIGQGGEVFVLEMGDQVKIDELARLMIQLAGLVPEQDIKIKYVGARPGEKLTEQLFSENEFLERTKEDSVYKVSQNPENIDLPDLSMLKLAVDANDQKKALTILKKFAPNLKIND